MTATRRSMRARVRFETSLPDGVVWAARKVTCGIWRPDRPLHFRASNRDAAFSPIACPTPLQPQARTAIRQRCVTMRPSGPDSHTIHRNASTLFWPFRDVLRFCAMRTPCCGVGSLRPTCDCLRAFHRCSSDATSPFGVPGSFDDRPQMKVLILAPFAAAIISSIIWSEAAERNLTRTQKVAFGVTALVAWALVLVVGNIVT
jgi:hypothetical protein